VQLLGLRVENVPPLHLLDLLLVLFALELEAVHISLREETDDLGIVEGRRARIQGDNMSSRRKVWKLTVGRWDGKKILSPGRVQEILALVFVLDVVDGSAAEEICQYWLP
jgi:hypothetical protein